MLTAPAVKEGQGPIVQHAASIRAVEGAPAAGAWGEAEGARGARGRMLVACRGKTRRSGLCAAEAALCGPQNPHVVGLGDHLGVTPIRACLCRPRFGGRLVKQSPATGPRSERVTGPGRRTGICRAADRTVRATASGITQEHGALLGPSRRRQRAGETGGPAAPVLPVQPVHGPESTRIRIDTAVVSERGSWASPKRFPSVGGVLLVGAAGVYAARGCAWGVHAVMNVIMPRSTAPWDVRRTGTLAGRHVVVPRAVRP